MSRARPKAAGPRSVAPTVASCPTCRASIPPGARFCPACGHNLASRRGEESVSATTPTPPTAPQAPRSLPAAGLATRLRFAKPWRDYQARVLAALETHLSDERLHVVAAPGSGKTVLGIEIVRRLDLHVLVLVPTIAIREQWVERILRDFLPPEGARPTWISTDLRRPAPITIVTYQALHARLTGTKEDVEADAEEEVDDLAESPERLLAKAPLDDRIGTLVLDECHHLRNEWWRSIAAAIDSLPGTKVVSLTATPPFDVEPHEWDRYLEVCGPIDAEISVPELVRANNLAPHQDLVHISFPPPEAAARIAAFRTGTEAFTSALPRNERLLTALAVHPWVAAAGPPNEAFAEPEILSALVIFLKAAGRHVPRNLLKAMGVSGKRVPAWNAEWAEVLLGALLYGPLSPTLADPELVPQLRKELRSLGALEHRTVLLRDSPHLQGLLTRSSSKIDSVAHIARLEWDNLGTDLRLVVLADFIRLQDVQTELAPEQRRLGVLPLFKAVAHALPKEARIAVLTGSYVSVPTATLSALKKSGAARRVDIEHSLDPAFADHVRVRIDDGNRSQLVHLMTALLGAGQLHVVVGTKSLLGEGWDAPQINSLVLASYVGSYMLSNQMRGRAIRIDPANPRKVANVWHLVCIDPFAPDGGADLAMLERRFRVFVGIGAGPIQNGLARVNLEPRSISAAEAEAHNDVTQARARDRAAAAQEWERALADPQSELTEALEPPPKLGPRSWVFSNTLMSLLWTGGMISLFVLAQLLRGLRAVNSENVLPVLAVIFGLSALPFLFYSVRALWLLLRHGTYEGSLRQIGRAVLESLAWSGYIRTPMKSLEIEVTKTGNVGGAKRLSLKGGTTHESWTFLDALEQVLGPVEEPRYLLRTRRLIQREAFAPVPEVLGRKKNHAERFVREWRRRMGPARLEFTRNSEGRRLLLRARTRALANRFVARSRRISVWR